MRALGRQTIGNIVVCATLLTTISGRLSAQTTATQETTADDRNSDTESLLAHDARSTPATASAPKPVSAKPNEGERGLRDSSHALLPDYMRSKRRMSQDDIDNKKEGLYVTAVPMAMYDTNKGIGLGARGFLIDNGTSDSPFFDYSPYRHRTYLQALATTGGWQMHKLDYDGLYVGNSPFRIRATAFYERNTCSSAESGPRDFSGIGLRLGENAVST
jgi:hypothetical protein